ncbi:nephrin-like [Panulirus ornatus]|uniref:nephrin-like n=1 Tax=Panulirus ornatus TaxID=150431 RepID=UPI003A8A75A4
MLRAELAPLWTVNLLSLISQGLGVQQTFRVTPQSVEVVAGSDVTLRCEVENQQGSAQWTKDGFALGFNRSIPGFQRYAVLGDESAGVHNLRIRNVTLRDDGDYQCQVTPYRDARAIRHAANLTVLLPPTSIEMVGLVAEAPVTVRAGEPLKLECLIKDSKPVSQVVWYRAATPLRLNSQVDSRERSGSGPHLSTLRTKITFTPTPSDNGAEYSCHALHPALLPQHTPLVARVRLDVHYEPGTPQITGYEQKEVLHPGHHQRLTCRVSGGNPAPEVAWYREGALVDPDFTTHGNYSVNAYEFQVKASDNLAKYECRVTNAVTPEAKLAEVQARVHCKLGRGAGRGTLPGYTVRWAEYRCEAKNAATVEPLVASVILSVLFPPSEVSVSARPLPIKADSHATLICESGASNPQTKLSWWRDDSQLQPGDVEVKPGQFGGTTTRYSVKVGVRMEDDGAVFTCHAHNHLGATLQGNLTLSVFYPPVWVEEPAHQLEVSEGENVLVQARARGNPPHVTFLWRHLREEGDEAEAVMRGPVLNLTEVTRDQAGLYTVRASNSEGNATRNVTVRVKYSAVITSVTDVQTVSVGESATLACMARARPLPNLTWRRPGYDFTRTHLRQLPAQNGLQLIIRNATIDDMGAFTCVAMNEVGDAAVANATLLISHKPTIDESVRRQRTSAEVGRDARLICRASGAPTVRFAWYTHRHTLIHPPTYTRADQRYFLEDPKVLDGLVTYESVLLVKNVTAEDYGDFECRAENRLGSSRVTLRLQAPTKPDTPLHLQVTNATHNSVHLAWTPAYDGGLHQKFRIRFRADHTSRYHYRDVYPENVTRFSVRGLAPATTYHFQVVAYNRRGQSSYNHQPVLATTTGLRRSSVSAPPAKTHMSGLIVVITTLVSVALLVLNVTLITCFIKRRARKRLTASLDKGSTKTATRGFLPPAAATEGVLGQTLTPMSEKVVCEDTSGRQECQASCVRAATTCLVHPLDPPPQYAHSPPPPALLPPQYAHGPPAAAVLPPPQTDLTLGICDDGRRLQHSAAMESEARYGDPAWRTSSPPEQYEITSLDPVYPLPTRHTAHHPPPSTHAQSNGPVRRNTPFRLHITKDYIRGGNRNPPMSSSVGVGEGLQFATPQAHVHALPLTSTPLLSALALGARRPPQAEVPLEQRGHLV